MAEPGELLPAELPTGQEERGRGQQNASAEYSAQEAAPDTQKEHADQHAPAPAPAGLNDRGVSRGANIAAASDRSQPSNGGGNTRCNESVDAALTARALHVQGVPLEAQVCDGSATLFSSSAVSLLPCSLLPFRSLACLTLTASRLLRRRRPTYKPSLPALVAWTTSPARKGSLAGTESSPAWSLWTRLPP
jgi:hypothetical protein